MFKLALLWDGIAMCTVMKIQWNTSAQGFTAVYWLKTKGYLCTPVHCQYRISETQETTKKVGWKLPVTFPKDWSPQKCVAGIQY